MESPLAQPNNVESGGAEGVRRRRNKGNKEEGEEEKGLAVWWRRDAGG